MTNILYSDEFLLDRLYKKIEGKTSQKYIVTKPISEKKNRKTFIINFGAVCTSLRRELNALKTYIETELQIDTSIMENNVLVINKIYQQSDIEKVISRFIKTYVLCSEPKCGSGNTEIIKENRISYLVCKVCCSKKAI